MNDRTESIVKRLWLLASSASLVFPLLLNFFDYRGESFSGAIEVSVIALFGLTLPSSFFALPLLALFRYILEIDTGELFGAYLYLILLNLVGYIQYFKLMPVFFGRTKPIRFESILE